MRSPKINLIDHPLKMSSLYIAKRSDAPGLLKIGRSNNPAARLVQLQTGHCFNMVPVTIFPGLGHMESAIQRALRPSRIDTGYGREWFEASTADVLNIIGNRLDSSGSDTESTTVPSDRSESWLEDQLREFIRDHLVSCDTMDEAPNYGRILAAFGNFLGDGYGKDALKATMLDYGFVPERYHSRNAFGHKTTRRVFCLYIGDFSGPVALIRATGD